MYRLVVCRLYLYSLDDIVLHTVMSHEGQSKDPPRADSRGPIMNRAPRSRRCLPCARPCGSIYPKHSSTAINISKPLSICITVCLNHYPYVYHPSRLVPRRRCLPCARPCGSARVPPTAPATEVTDVTVVTEPVEKRGS